MIIAANELLKSSVGCARENIVNILCESMMAKIVDANKRGQRKCLFQACAYHNEDGSLSTRYCPCKSMSYEDQIIRLEDYREEVQAEFEKAGYTIKPYGYSGGVWQTETWNICW